MSISIGDNFKYLGKKFLDDRESFATLEAMKYCVSVPDGFVTYCKEDGKRYEFKSSNNINELTGQWSEYSVKGVGSHYFGTEQPTDDDVIWFFDNRESTSAPNMTYDNPVIAELFSYIQSLQSQITKLQADVEYLKLNGGGGIPVEPEDPSEFFVMLEDDGLFVLEDGGFLLQEDSVIAKDSTLMLEDGADLLLEDGSRILLESTRSNI